MATPQRHKIRELVVELDAPWEVQLPKIQHRLQVLLHGEIKSKIEKWLDQYAPADQLIDLGDLELDLGDLSEYNLEQDFERHFEACILPILKERLRNLTAPHAIDPKAPQADWVPFFLKRGALPWWVSAIPAAEIPAAFRLWLKDKPADAQALLRKDAKALARMLYHLPEMDWEMLLELVPASQRPWLKGWWQRFKIGLQRQKPTIREAIKAAAFEVALQWSFSRPDAADAEAAFAQVFRQKMLAKFPDWEGIEGGKNLSIGNVATAAPTAEMVWQAIISGRQKGSSPQSRMEIWEQLSPAQRTAQWSKPAFLQWLSTPSAQTMPEQWWESWDRMGVSGHWKQPTLIWEHWQHALQPLEGESHAIPWIALRKKFIREWQPRGNDAQSLRQEILVWILAEWKKLDDSSPAQWFASIAQSIASGTEIPPFVARQAVELALEAELADLFTNLSPSKRAAFIRRNWARWTQEGETYLPKGTFAHWAKELLGKRFKHFDAWIKRLQPSLPSSAAAFSFHPSHPQFWLAVLEAAAFKEKEAETAYLQGQFRAIQQENILSPSALRQLFGQNPWRIALPDLDLQPAQSQPVAWQDHPAFAQQLAYWIHLPLQKWEWVKVGENEMMQGLVQEWEREVKRIAQLHFGAGAEPSQDLEALEQHWAQAFRAFWWHSPAEMATQLQAIGEANEAFATPELPHFPAIPSAAALRQILTVSAGSGSVSLGKAAILHWAKSPGLPALLANLPTDQRELVLGWFAPQWQVQLDQALTVWEAADLPAKAFWIVIFSFLFSTSSSPVLIHALQSLLQHNPEAETRISLFLRSSSEDLGPWAHLFPSSSLLSHPSWQKWEKHLESHPQFQESIRDKWRAFLSRQQAKPAQISWKILSEWANWLNITPAEWVEWAIQAAPTEDAKALVAFLPVASPLLPQAIWNPISGFPKTAELIQMVSEAETLSASRQKMETLWETWGAKAGFVDWVAALPFNLQTTLLKWKAPAHFSFVASLRKDWEILTMEANAIPVNERDFWRQIWRTLSDYRPGAAMQQQWVQGILGTIGIPSTAYLPLIVRVSHTLKLGKWFSDAAKLLPPAEPLEPETEWVQFLLHGKLMPGLEMASVKTRMLALAKSHPQVMRQILRKMGSSATVAHNIQLLLAEAEWLELTGNLLQLPLISLKQLHAETRKWMQADSTLSKWAPEWSKQLIQLGWQAASVRNLADLWEKATLLTAAMAKIPLSQFLLQLDRSFQSLSLPLLFHSSSGIRQTWESEIANLQEPKPDSAQAFLRRQFPYHGPQIDDCFALMLRLIPTTVTPDTLWEIIAAPLRKRSMTWENWLMAAWKAFMGQWKSQSWASKLPDAWEQTLPHFLHPQSASRLLDALQAMELSVLPPPPTPALEAWETPENMPEIAVSYAGLVLMAPYMGRYFEVLGLMENGKFKGEKQRKRAIFLLIYLAGGQKPTEAELLLPKILCGKDWDAWLPPTAIRVKQREADLTLSLLATAISYWTTLGTTSPETMQETFLQRKGTLAITEEKWILTVDSQSYDLLLRTLPWGISPVNLPWMKQLLHVEWKY